MSVCGQNGPTEDENASEDVVAPARDLYKQKPVSKVVRVLTVLAYLLSVSLAAILLSVYYVCVWKSPELPPINGTERVELSGLHGSLHEYMGHNSTGGGDTSMNGTTAKPSTSNETNLFTNTTPTSIFDSNSTYGPSVHRDSTTQYSQTSTISDDIGAYNETDTVT